MTDFSSDITFPVPGGLRALAIAAVAVAAVAYPTAYAAEPVPPGAKPVPQAAVEVLNKLSGGPHPGFRANHAKGVLVTGSFIPAASAASLSMAPHLTSEQPVAVLVRFSNATGIPALADGDGNASPHGIAIRFQLPDGQSTDIVSISSNGFPVGTPEEFVALLQAISLTGPVTPKPTPIEQFMGSHPIALKWATTPRPAPVSFATLAYYGVNAFKFTNAAGQSAYARYQILPLAGEQALPESELKKASANFLMEELPLRIAKGPVGFRLVAQVAEGSDPINDGSLVWPSSRKLIELGTLRITGTVANQVAEQKTLLFNPLSLTPGIAASDDPVLLIRPAAYGVSYGQRFQ